MSGGTAYVRDRLPGWRAEGEIPPADWQRLAELVPMGTGRLREVDAAIGTLLAAGDPGVPGAYAINEICGRLLSTEAPDLVPDLAAGRLRLSLGLTEPGTGSDLAAMSTQVRDGRLYGRKTFIANGTVADQVIVAARTGTGGAGGQLPLIDLYLVDRRQLAVRDLDGAGVALMRLTDITLDGIPVDEVRRLGRPGRGFGVINQVLTFERAIVGCLAVRYAGVLLDQLAHYLEEKQVFGRALADHEYHRLRLADWWSEYRLQALTLEALITAADAGQPAWQDIYALKIRASDFLVRLANDLQHLGGAESWVAGGRWRGVVDDVRWFRLAGGVVEVLQERLATDLLARARRSASETPTKQGETGE